MTDKQFMTIDDTPTPPSGKGARGDRRRALISIALVAIGMGTCLINQYATDSTYCPIKVLKINDILRDVDPPNT